MKTNFSQLKLAFICLLTTISFNVLAQTPITSIGDFTAANANMKSISQVICTGKKVTFAIPASTTQTYVWQTRFAGDQDQTGGTTLGANDGNFTEGTALAAGYYRYKLKVTDNATLCSEIVDQLVYVLPDPTITVTSPTIADACTNDSKGFAFTSAITGNTEGSTLIFPVNYQWYTQIGTDAAVAVSGATTKDASITSPTTAGTYKVFVQASYQLKSTCDPKKSTEGQLKVNTPPTAPTITIAGS